jgi:hypothetical protein
VANALGAVAGKIRASCTVEIRPDYSVAGVSGYSVFGYTSNKKFKKLSEAEAFAAEEAKAGAREEARKRGGGGEPEIVLEYHKHEGSARDGVIYMGTAVTARAIAEAG